LARARELLRTRLTRKGIALGLGLFAPDLVKRSSAVVPATLLNTTTQAATLFAAGNTVAAGAISARAGFLAQGALKTMLVNKLQAVAVLLVTLGLLGAGTGMLLKSAAADPSAGAAQGAEQPDRAERTEVAAEQGAAKTDAIKLIPRSRKVHKALALAIT